MQRLEQLLAVNPFQKLVEVDKKPEAVQDVKLETSEKVISVFEEYKKAYSHLKNNSIFKFEHIARLKLDVLSPSEINFMLQLIMGIGVEKFDPVPGYMVSRLIKDSYNAGNNNFTLTVNDCNIDYLFDNVCGTKKIPVIATVIGNVGKDFGYEAERCTIDVKGNVSQGFGFGSKHCNYTLQGNTGKLCGNLSEDCTYNIIGNAGDSCGKGSEKCTYNITGNAENWLGINSKTSAYNVFGESKLPGLGSERCTFNIYRKNIHSPSESINNFTLKVRDREIYDQLKLLRQMRSRKWD